MTLRAGDPAPNFTAASSVNPKFRFETSAGRYIVLSFFFSTAHPFSARLIELINERRERFDVRNFAFFGVSIDPDDQQKLKQESPGIMYFWDFDKAVSKMFGVIPENTNGIAVAPVTMILDQAQRIIAMLVASGTAEAHVEQLFGILDALPKLDSLNWPAPIMVVPYVFEAELCKTLIDYYNAHEKVDSGFMRDVEGKTVAMLDHSHKKRSDCEITDPELIRAAQLRLSRRLLPAIRLAFAFNATRIERHMVACYDADAGGHFNAHRDNTTLGTAHRRFAVTINLNAEEFDGGDLWFPEFGRRKYRAPTGGAIVFSCSLLHEASPVMRGRRFAFLPFLYDDDAAEIRQRNLRFLSSPASNDAPVPTGVSIPSS